MCDKAQRRLDDAMMIGLCHPVSGVRSVPTCQLMSQHRGQWSNGVPLPGDDSPRCHPMSANHVQSSPSSPLTPLHCIETSFCWFNSPRDQSNNSFEQKMLEATWFLVQIGFSAFCCHLGCGYGFHLPPIIWGMWRWRAKCGVWPVKSKGADGAKWPQFTSAWASEQLVIASSRSEVSELQFRFSAVLKVKRS